MKRFFSDVAVLIHRVLVARLGHGVLMMCVMLWRVASMWQRMLSGLSTKCHKKGKCYQKSLRKICNYHNKKDLAYCSQPKSALF